MRGRGDEGDGDGVELCDGGGFWDGEDERLFGGERDTGELSRGDELYAEILRALFL